MDSECLKKEAEAIFEQLEEWATYRGRNIPVGEVVSDPLYRHLAVDLLESKLLAVNALAYLEGQNAGCRKTMKVSPTIPE